jgi:tetratricopeptide (TPR) repeat protein
VKNHNHFKYVNKALFMTLKRNQPCPCGSGKRYKNCCAVLQKDLPASTKELACCLVDQGNVVLVDKKHKEALKLYQEAVAIYPEYARAHYNIGVVFGKIGAKERAVVSFQKALSIEPEDAYAYYNIGVIRQEQGKEEEATACFQKAVAIRPDYAEAHYNLGVVFKNQGLFGKSAASFQEALSIKPNYAKALTMLGNIFKEQGQLKDAADRYKQALVVKYDCADTLYNLGVLRKQQGRLDVAVDCCQKALAIKPDYAEAHRCLASLLKYTKVDDHIEEMEKIISKIETTSAQKMHLAFALGKAYEELGEHEKAFTYLWEGNKRKRETFFYSTDQEKLIFNKIKNVFTDTFISKNLKVGVPDKTPIFILGMLRSGTSLVEQILASHPDVYGAGELEDFKEVVLRATDTTLQNEVFENISKDGGRIITKIGTEYSKKLREHSATAKFITDKMPGNFLFIGAIILALPNAKIIHCVRNPMDNCFSIYKNLFVGEHKYAYDLRELGRYHLLHQDLMRYWHEIFPGKIYAISYEKLVNDQEVETRKLLKHCGLSWDEACLSFHKTSRAVTTASAVQVRKPIYKESVQLWKKYEKQLQPLSKLLSG